MSNRIEIGDKVQVFCNGVRCIEGIVDHTPQATGDSWIIVTALDSIYYVQIFECMKKVCE